MSPKAFISYSWDDDAHKDWVRQLASRLRSDGVDVTLDRWHAAPGEQIPQFMERAVRESDFVIAVCTPRFKEKSDGRGGGVGYEGDIMTAYAFTGALEKKFIPVLRHGEWYQSAPTWLLGRAAIDLRGDAYSESQYEELLRTLHGERELAPPIGPRPNFEGEKGSRPSPASTTKPEWSSPTRRGSPGTADDSTDESPVTPVWESGPLDRFNKIWASYRAVIGYVIGFGGMPLILDYLFAIGPPYPHRTGVGALTSIVAWVMLLFVYSSWDTISRTALNDRIKKISPIILSALAVYIIAFAAFTTPAPDDRHLVAKGFLLRPEIAKLLDTKNGTLTAIDLLEGAGYEAARIWQPWTVAVANLTLLFSWLVFFGCLSYLVSVFVLAEHKRYERIRRLETKLRS